MSSSQLLEHAGYFHDTVKHRAYQEALAQVITPGDVVLDLGAGAGLLGLLAARAGAGRVYMVDSGPILGLAVEIAKANGFADCVVPVRAHSTEVTLPELVDVVVCDQIGGFVYDAGVLKFFADARARLLKPDGHLVPGAFRLYLAPVAAPDVREQVDLWAGHPAGLDTGPAHRVAVNNAWPVEPAQVEVLTPPAELGGLSSWSQDRLEHAASFEFDTTDTVDGLVGWFDTELAPGVGLTNDPRDPGRMERWCNFYPLPEPVRVEPGDQIDLAVDLRPDPGILSWKTTVTQAGSTLGPWRQSTLLGQLLGGEDLLKAATGRPRAATTSTQAVATALALVDGRRSTDEIVAETLNQHPDAFPNHAAGARLLSAEVTRLTRVVE